MACADGDVGVESAGFIVVVVVVVVVGGGGGDSWNFLQILSFVFLE